MPSCGADFQMTKRKGNVYTDKPEYIFLIDPENTQYRMEFSRCDETANWSLFCSTFPNTMRKYQALQFFIANVGKLRKKKGEWIQLENYMG